MIKNNVIPLFGYGVYEFSWGTAVKEERTGKWKTLIISPSGQEINVDGLNVILHENGIEFI